MKVISKTVFLILGLMLFSKVVFATTDNSNSMSFMFYILQGVFFLLVFLIYPLFCWFKKQAQSAHLKGLNLPQGSVRAMIAIGIIGSYLITLSIGIFLIEKEIFNLILTAFGTLSGAVIGFYFGSGGSGGKTSG